MCFCVTDSDWSQLKGWLFFYFTLMFAKAEHEKVLHAGKNSFLNIHLQVLINVWMEQSGGCWWIWPRWHNAVIIALLVYMPKAQQSQGKPIFNQTPVLKLYPFKFIKIKMTDVLTFLQIWGTGGLGKNRQGLLEFTVQASTLPLSETLPGYKWLSAVSFLFKSLRKNLVNYCVLQCEWHMIFTMVSPLRSI